MIWTRVGPAVTLPPGVIRCLAAARVWRPNVNRSSIVRGIFSGFRAVVVATAACCGLWAHPAFTATIRYSISGTVNGSLNGTPFTGQTLALTTIADTANIDYQVVSSIIPIYWVPGTTTFQLGSSSGTFIAATYGVFSEDASVFLANTGVVGIGLSTGGGNGHAILGALTPLPPFYGLSTGYDVVGNAVTDDSYASTTGFDTTAGTLFLSSVSGLASFTAAVVPEIDPASMGSALALIGGGLGLLERRRKRA